MMRRYFFLAASVLVLLAATTSAKADLIVSVGSLNLAPGGTGTVDVTISSTTGLDVLDIFGSEFRITTAGSSGLEFVNAPADTQLNSANYVLPLTDSTSASVAALCGMPSGVVSTASTNNDTYIGGDGTISGSGVIVPTSGKLEVTLGVTTSTANVPLAGDTFTISLVDSANTFFWSPSGDNIAVTSTPGTLSIVPEPTTAVMLLGLLGMVGLIARKRLRRSECS